MWGHKTIRFWPPKIGLLQLQFSKSTKHHKNLRDLGIILGSINLSQFMRFWYLPHMPSVQAQVKSGAVDELIPKFGPLSLLDTS